jgi:hypothetical protein
MGTDRPLVCIWAPATWPTSQPLRRPWRKSGFPADEDDLGAVPADWRRSRLPHQGFPALLARSGIRHSVPVRRYLALADVLGVEMVPQIDDLIAILLPQPKAILLGRTIGQFVFFQRGHRRSTALGILIMRLFPSVTNHGHRMSLVVAAGLRSLDNRVTVGMERHALNGGLFAVLGKSSGPVVLAHCG